jgi:hypothetical protein
MMEIGSMTFWRQLDVESETLMNGINTFIKQAQGNPLLYII